MAARGPVGCGGPPSPSETTSERGREGARRAAGARQEATMRRRDGLHPMGVLCFLGLALLSAPGVGEAQVAKVRLATSLSPPSLDSIVAYVAAEAGIFRKQGPP